MSTTTVQDGQGRITEQTVDLGNGTGTRTTYDSNGTVTGTETITGLEVAPLPTDEPGLRQPLPPLEEDYA